MDIHVTHEHATKRYGVEQLTEMLSLPKEQVMAIGDGHNDMPLLEAAGLKVAMGNAPDEVKQLANYIAPTLADDGVAAAIEKFIL
jgi:hydroxymethylpyrimidine pyrophosphatase-like HAD family hydrolase